uniref:Uncharacterized protein n=1 Tax=Hemiselmis tepida TaxID=464990 RepID=A0A7S0VGU9_9CRYP|mmetsp:Transcript_1638/g.4119  ORF Transcript_1638/g.4119 Transcript_1638/m.4119 type:complete len:129 (+) Transcript_1638:3-389(+)
MPPDARRPRGRTGLRPVTGAQMLYKRQLDTGEDYYSAIQAPDKYYSWPWLRDGKYYDSARYGVVDVFSDKPEYGKQVYERRPYDEHGDKAFDVDMSVADPCYDDDGIDCYRETFDAKTGYPLPLEPEK